MHIRTGPFCRNNSAPTDYEFLPETKPLPSSLQAGLTGSVHQPHSACQGFWQNTNNEHAQPLLQGSKPGRYKALLIR